MMIFSKISKSITLTKDKKRIIIKEPNFETSLDFKIMNLFQSIFGCTKIEIRCQYRSWVLSTPDSPINCILPTTWIFNITNEETLLMIQHLREWLNIDYFRNFLMEVDVSVTVDLEKKVIIITNEKPTKFKFFIDIARQLARIFEILRYLDITKNNKMKYLKHYKMKKTKEFLVFQIPLSSENHLSENNTAVSFIITFNEKNMQLNHKIEVQTSSSLSVQIHPNFSQSFLLQTLKRDITNIGDVLDSLDNSADTLVEFNEYILGRILYPSIMDGEDKYNVTFVTRSRNEMTIYYRDFFALDIVFPTESKTSVFQFNIYDKAKSTFYTEEDE